MGTTTLTTLTTLTKTFGCAALLACLACGGGGGGGGGPKKAAAGGSIAAFDGSSSVLEAEPNDNVEQAHFLGNLTPGQTITVLGNAHETEDRFDGFRLQAPSRLRVDVSLAFEQGDDFDLLVYDSVAAAFVEAFASAADNPEEGSFHAKGSFHLVVDAFAGAGSYTLTITGVAPADPILEREPNDTNLTAQYLGEIAVGDQLALAGDVGATQPGNVSSRFLLTLVAPADLAFLLDFDGGADLVINLYDATGDIEHPTFLATLSTGSPPLQDVIGIDGAGLLQIEVMAASGTSEFLLQIAASPLTPAPGASALTQGMPPIGLRLSPLEHEARLRRGAPAGEFYGEARLDAVPGELLVRMREGAALAPILGERALREQARIPGHASLLRFDLPPGLSDQERARRTLGLAHSLAARSDVLYAERNHIWQRQDTPNDPFYNLQWHYPLIQLPEAWDVQKGSNSVIVAVIDTGGTGHPDLVARQQNVSHYDFITDPQISGDGDGPDPDATDVGDGNGVQPSSFHGTHVAGTVGADTDNGSGVAGVTWAGRIMHVRVLGIGGGTNFDIANGILYAGGQPNSVGVLPNEAAHVINLSLGGPGFSQTVQNVVTQVHNAGTVVLAAAGNNNSPEPFYPAAYDNVISVSAVDLNANKAPYSNFHATVDVAAPGGDVSVDLNGDGYQDGVLSPLMDDSQGGFEPIYKFYQGTSMACPHAAGVAALMLSENPSLSPDQVAQILASTATDRGAPGHDPIYGHGLINAFKAVQQAGGGGGGSPILGLSTQTVSFAPGDTTREVGVINLGGGLLQLTQVAVGTADGGDWLDVVPVVVQNPTTTEVSALSMTVDRTGLADGAYQASVTVQSNGGTKTVQVSLIVAPSATGANVDIFVLLVDPDTLETAAQDVVNPAFDLDYGFSQIDPGGYILVAGSDVNDDGFIGDPDEPYFGAWPTLDHPQILELQPGDSVQGLDFTVSGGFTGLSTGTARPSYRRLE